MTQTLELTTSELALIENARKQEALAQEARELQNAAKLTKETIEMEAYIAKEIRIGHEQVDAAINFESSLKKLNPKYKMITTTRQVYREIYNGYGDTKVILKEFNYEVKSAHIILEGTEYKINVEKHLVYGNKWSTRVTDNGYKMLLVGGGFYNERFVLQAKALNKKIEDKLELVQSKITQANKLQDAVSFVVNDLSIRYPEAIVIAGTEWERDYYDKHKGSSINIVTIKLSNKIEMKFKVYGDKSISKMEIRYPTKDNYQLLELMNGLVIPE